MPSFLNHLLVVGVLASAGCSTFKPATLDSVPLGTDVRLQLTDAGEARVEEFVGREGSEVIQGTLLRANRDSLSLETWRADMVATRSFQAGRIAVPLGRADVIGVEQKEFSAARTAGLTAALLGVGFLLITEVFGGSEGTGITGGGPGPIISLVPGLHLGR